METTKEQQLQKALNELLFPNIKDRLKKGCQVLSKYYGIITLSQDTEKTSSGKFYSCYGFDLEKGLPRSVAGLDFETVGYPISLELIIAALEKKNATGIYYAHRRGVLSFIWISDVDPTEIPFTPLQPLPQESIDRLLEIFSN